MSKSYGCRNQHSIFKHSKECRNSVIFQLYTVFKYVLFLNADYSALRLKELTPCWFKELWELSLQKKIKRVLSNSGLFLLIAFGIDHAEGRFFRNGNIPLHHTGAAGRKSWVQQIHRWRLFMSVPRDGASRECSDGREASSGGVSCVCDVYWRYFVQGSSLGVVQSLGGAGLGVHTTSTKELHNSQTTETKTSFFWLNMCFLKSSNQSMMRIKNLFNVGYEKVSLQLNQSSNWIKWWSRTHFYIQVKYTEEVRERCFSRYSTWKLIIMVMQVLSSFPMYGNLLGKICCYWPIAFEASQKVANRQLEKK